MKSGFLSSSLFIWVGLCLSGVLPDGVWSEWRYAQWGFVRRDFYKFNTMQRTSIIKGLKMTDNTKFGCFNVC